MDQLLLTIEESRVQIGHKGRNFLYGLLNSGQVESVKLGHRRMIVSASLRAYVNRLRQQAQEDRERDSDVAE